jgi:hypothetical protein
MFSFAVMTVGLGKDKLEAILFAFLICYGITAVGDGIVSVPWAVLAGTSLDSRWRARMFGLQSASAGGIVLSRAGPAFPNNYALIFGSAGLLFVLSILPPLFIHELPGGKVAKKIPSMGEYLPSLGHVLRTDIAFRAMIITRMLTSLFAMANPFYIGYATVQLGLSSTIAVPILLAMQTIGGVSGAMVYTWPGARSNLAMRHCSSWRWQWCWVHCSFRYATFTVHVNRLCHHPPPGRACRSRLARARYPGAFILSK